MIKLLSKNWFLGDISMDTICVEDMCVDGYRFSEVVFHSHPEVRFDGILGLGAKHSVRSFTYFRLHKKNAKILWQEIVSERKEFFYVYRYYQIHKVESV